VLHIPAKNVSFASYYTVLPPYHVMKTYRGVKKELDLWTWWTGVVTVTHRILIYGVQLKCADKPRARVPHIKTRKNLHITTCPETFNLWVIAERILSWLIQLLSTWWWWLFGRLACFATLAYRQPQPRFLLTWSAKATGRCTAGSQRTNVVHVRWCSGPF
jgi:hypothetical protein